MLRYNHKGYEHLYVYYLDTLWLPPIEHHDLIGLWIEDEHSILFFHTPQDKLVRGICLQSNARVIYQADLDYNDWEAGVAIEPFSTKAVSVRPVWDTKPLHKEDGAGQEILLDPSVVFGSGFHPTTRLCLETLEMLMVVSGNRIHKVAELGAGTGLLAIAAAKLGADKVTALDNNPLACEVAQNNCVINGCASQVAVVKHDLENSIPELDEYDLVVANLYKGLLEQLFANPSFWRARIYIISGIIPAMEGELLAVLPQKGIHFLHRAKSEMWRLWVLSTEKTGEEVE